MEFVVELAEMLRELLGSEPGMPSHDDVVARAEAMISRAIDAGLISPDES